MKLRQHAVVLTAATVAALVAVPAHAAPPAGVRPAASRSAAPEHVRVRDLPPPAAGDQVTRTTTPRRSGGPVAPAGKTIPPGAEVTLVDQPAAGPLTAGGSTPARLSSWDGIGVGCCEPPDTQVGVGPSHVFEMVNLTGRIWTKDGAQVSSFGLASFFLSPSIAMTSPKYTDPRVYYDALSSRWFASILVVENCAHDGNPACGTGTTYQNSDVRLAVSGSSDPTGSWLVYSVDSNTSGVMYDQPRLGVNDDKVLVTHDDFGTSYLGEKYAIAQKSDLTSGVSVLIDLYARDATKRWVIPARSLSATTTEYAAHASGSTLTVLKFIGTPRAGSGTSFTTNTLTIGTLATPPGAQQPGTGAGLIDTGDENIQSVMWRSNTLWTAATESCTPSGDTTTRACLRFDKVSTSSSPVTLTSDTRVSGSGTYYYFPSVVTTSAGDVFAGFTTSSSTRYASAEILYGQGGTFGASAPSIIYAAGSSTYTGSRWGDYSEIAVDPSNSDDVWTAQEYGATTTSPSSSWGTAVGQFTAVSPTITSLSPASGPTGGGNTVDIFGRELSQGGSVTWDGSSIGYTWVSSGNIRVTAPAHTAGSVSVTVTSSAGTSGAATYTYNGPSISSVSPNQGSNLGGQTVTILGNNFSNASSVTFGGTAASFTVDSNTQITATTPAHANGTVDVRVTAGGTTSAIVTADHYTYVTPPTVTGVSPPLGLTLLSESVTITGTGFTGATSVTFGGVPASFTVVSPTQIVANSPLVPVTMIGFFDVRVTANGAVSPVTSADQFLYL